MTITQISHRVYNLGYAVGHFFNKLFLYATSTSFRSFTWLRYFTYIPDLIIRYKKWWISLFCNDPTHVCIETFLIAFLLYMVVGRKTNDWRKLIKNKLTEEEKEELLSEWKVRERLPLVPNSHSVITSMNSIMNEKIYLGNKGMFNTKLGTGIIVSQVNGSKMTIHMKHGGDIDIRENEYQYIFNNKRIKEKEKIMMKNNMFLEFSTKAIDTSSEKIESKEKFKTVINFATYDYLGVSCPIHYNNTVNSLKNDIYPSDIIKKASIDAFDIYGFGSCGPRGFYGTIDAHLHLESEVAKFLRTDSAILYSDASAAVSSAIAAFAKRGDLLVVDQGVNEAIVTGVTLSRANVKYFKNNNMNDLRCVLERIRATDHLLKRKLNDQRRFIVTEGLYSHYGTVCPIEEIIQLKEEFSYRLIIDESHSFGTFGQSGRGVLEQYGFQPMKDAEIVIISLENALGSGGGIVVGNYEIVDHQRLSGAGYCFSASLPPFMACAAVASLKRIEDEPWHLKKLKDNVKYMYNNLECMLNSFKNYCWRLKITSFVEVSPLVFLQLVQNIERVHDQKDMSKMITWSREKQTYILDKISKVCLDNNVVLISTGGHVIQHLAAVPPPSLRLTVMSKQSRDDIDTVTQVLRDAIISVMKGNIL